ncbi:MAG: polysaccharide deacetylase family protein [Oligoflexia bacterium]|nr:polysaccharide deacetylase family protein [Oligoflexia bacterium]
MLIKEIVKNILRSPYKKLFWALGSSRLSDFVFPGHKSQFLILMYHRVLPSSQITNNYIDLTMGLEKFEAQIRLISQRYLPISIEDLSIDDREGNKNIHLPVVITFDDGYRDNLVYALPILKRYNVPATIYVTTSYPDGNGTVWWYEVCDIIKDNEYLNFRYREKKYEFRLNNDLDRKNAYIELVKLFFYMTPSAQTELLSIIRDADKRPKSRCYRNLFLSWDEIKILAQEPLITIGAHTHRHYNLSMLDYDLLKEEILLSMHRLEEEIGIEIKHFAYPFGGDGFVTDREYEIVKKLEFRTAVTTYQHSQNEIVDPYQLPRYGMGSFFDEINLKKGLDPFFWKH